MPIVVKMLEDNKTSTERRGITLIVPPKEVGTGRLHDEVKLLTPLEKVRDFQRGLYLKAKQKKARKYYSLYDKVSRWDVLLTAWKKVRNNKGSAGVDGKSIEDIESYGAIQFLREIQKELQEKKYKPQRIKRVYIPKPNGEKRPLGIPVIKDRVVQMALKIVIEPIFEAEFQSCSYGFRPNRSAHQALKEIKRHLNLGKTKVVDVDLKAYFDSIPHDKLMKLLSKKIKDRNILWLIKSWLKAGVMGECERSRSEIKGTPQGGVISPLLANIYLNELDKQWKANHEKYYRGELIRYADDFVVLTAKQPYGILKTLQGIIKSLGLEINEKKTKILDMEKDELIFLGHSHKKIYDARKKVRYIISYPSANAMKAIKDKIRKQTRYSIPEKVKTIIEKINPVIRGWANYFSKGNSSKWFAKIRYYTENKIRRFMRKHSINKGFGYKKYTHEFLYKKLGLHYIKANRLCLEK